MPRFRKKPVVIEAVKWSGQNGEEIAAFLGSPPRLAGRSLVGDYDRGEAIAITTVEGVMRAEPGDWIIRGVKGEVYPCKPDIFEATYEALDPVLHGWVGAEWIFTQGDYGTRVFVALAVRHPITASLMRFGGEEYDRWDATDLDRAKATLIGYANAQPPG